MSKPRRKKNKKKIPYAYGPAKGLSGYGIGKHSSFRQFHKFVPAKTKTWEPGEKEQLIKELEERGRA